MEISDKLMKEISQLLADAGYDHQLIVVTKKKDDKTGQGQLTITGDKERLKQVLKYMIEDSDLLYEIIAPAVLNEMMRRSMPLRELIRDIDKKEVN